MPTSSQFKIISSLDEKRRRRWNEVCHLSNVENPYTNNADAADYHEEESGIIQAGPQLDSPVPKDRAVEKYLPGPAESNFSQTKTLFSPMSLSGRSASAGLNHSTAVKSPRITHSAMSGHASTTPEKNPLCLARPESTPREARSEEEERSDIAFTYNRLNLYSPETKKRLYCLGFRGVPGENADERENMETILQQRPGIAKKPQSNDEVKEAVVDFTPEDIDTICDFQFDYSSIDPKLLIPTAICFDANGLDITHQKLKKALDRILILYSSVKILKIQYEIHKLKDKTAANRWMIYTDSRLSRNLVSGRHLDLGGPTRTLLRRYDDIVLLQLKREMRVKAWKSMLGKTF